MSTYAHVKDNAVVDFKEIPSNIHAAWVSSGNPKATEYRLLVDLGAPEITNTQVTTITYTIQSTTVTRVWTIREREIEEYDKDDVKFIFQDFLLFNAGII